MTEDQIVKDWLIHHGDELPTVAYSKEVYEFIKATASRYQNMYCVNGVWQMIKSID